MLIVLSETRDSPLGDPRSALAEALQPPKLKSIDKAFEELLDIQAIAFKQDLDSDSGIRSPAICFNKEPIY